MKWIPRTNLSRIARQVPPPAPSVPPPLEESARQWVMEGRLERLKDTFYSSHIHAFGNGGEFEPHSPSLEKIHAARNGVAEGLKQLLHEERFPQMEDTIHYLLLYLPETLRATDTKTVGRLLNSFYVNSPWRFDRLAEAISKAGHKQFFTDLNDGQRQYIGSLEISRPVALRPQRGNRPIALNGSEP